NVCYIHLTLVPYIASAGEIKTKPTQHSVKELREIGIQADALLCRTIQPLPEDERRKIALFTNVQKEAVISAWDVDSIYKIPMMLHDQMLDEIVCHKLAILARAADLSAWRKIVEAQAHPEHEVDIAFVGKYVDLQDSYKSLNEALKHAGIHTSSKVNIHYFDSEELEKNAELGGTMRLGSQKCPVEPGTLAASIYGAEVNERHRHRYEVNNIYVPQLEAKGYKVSARTPSENLPEIMELPGHPFFVGVQFHPEFTSTPRDGHPLFK